MTQRVYVHVGLPKTGTTSIQEFLWFNRSATAAMGVRYPGHIYHAQPHAAMDLQGERYRTWWEPLVTGAWQRLVDQIRDWPGTSIVSCELLATATETQAARARNDLSFADVHVVCTARDLARQIPSVWQESVKNGDTVGYSAFRDALRTGEPIGMSDMFWEYQDIPRILRTWGAELPRDRVHVLTVPQHGPPDTVWRRFAELVGLDPDELPPVPNRNSSIGLPGAELLRRLNLELAENVGWARYGAVVKDQLAADVLAGRGRITLPARDRPWVRERAEGLVRQVAAGGYHVVGDLADLLPPVSGPDELAGPDEQAEAEPSEAEVLAEAVHALAGLVERVSPLPPGLAGLERLRHRLRELSDAYPTLMGVRRLYWTGKARLRRPGSGRDWHRLR
jgi:hypothetical protein